MHTISEQLFLINGNESRLTVGPDAIVWKPTSNNRNNNEDSKSSATQHDNRKKLHPTAANRLNLAQIVGTNHQSSTSDRDLGKSASKKRRLKLYYAKDNEFKSTSRLLKIKTLTIESIADSTSSSKRANSESLLPPNTSDSAELYQQQHKQQQLDDCDEKRSTSEPPSCYASDGSTSHLSNASSSSACSSPVQPENPPITIDADTQVGASLDDVGRLIEARLEQERQRHRPRRLLIFVNPYGGKGKAVRLYKTRVRRLLSLAKVQTELIITKHANHARETIEDPSFNVEDFDAIICIGGDGMFSELMNGLLFRYNRDRILDNKPIISDSIPTSNSGHQEHETSALSFETSTESTGSSESGSSSSSSSSSGSLDLNSLRTALGGIGKPFVSPPLPIGVIGAGSTDANSFGLIGTNDVVTATLNIILGKQIHIDICSVHSIEQDRLLRFVSTFVAYGYFGDVVRESEKLRWLGPSRYDVTGVNSLIKNRAYDGKVRILVSNQDGSPKDPKRCHTNCDTCKQLKDSPLDSELEFIERRGSFVGVNAAVTACRCPQTRKGFSPNNHLANGCVDLILVRPCSRMQYLRYLLRTGWTKKSAFDLKYVEAYRCRQFEFISQHEQQQQPISADKLTTGRPLNMSSNVSSSSSSAISSSSASIHSGSLEARQDRFARVTGSPSSKVGSCPNSSWNIDGEILEAASIRVKVNNRLLRVFGTGEPSFGASC